MKKDISLRLNKFSTTRVSIIGFCIFLTFSILFLPGQTELTKNYSAGSGSPDTSLFYTPAELYRTAETYGIEGRAAYVQARWTFDLAFPVIYTFFLVTSISWTAQRVLKPDHFLRRGNILPLYACLFDLLENTCTTMVFVRYPAYLPFMSMLAPFITLMKWICVGSSFTLLIGLSIAYLVKTIRSKRQQP